MGAVRVLQEMTIASAGGRGSEGRPNVCRTASPSRRQRDARSVPPVTSSATAPSILGSMFRQILTYALTNPYRERVHHRAPESLRLSLSRALAAGTRGFETCTDRSRPSVGALTGDERWA